MRRYNPNELEPKWQKFWADTQLYKAVDFDTSRPKFVVLTEFPYPSGDGLHLGHVREYSLGDIISRHKRMTGHNVLYPMGYDAFGLPTENYAIKNKIAPQVATDQNVGNFQKQFDSLGYSIDWDRAFRTTDPEYYKWTQWLFLQFFKAGLAYQDEIAINWCPFCKTGLANEEVVNGRHERCDTLVEKKTLKQWLMRITDYADRLIDGLNDVDYPSRIADQQVHWIGRSSGAEVTFKVDGSEDLAITVFTTRPDTLFGATFMVLAPEHPFVEQLITDEHKAKAEQYVKAAQAKSDIERQDTERKKTGAFTGSFAVNPVNNEKIPIWIADYVLMGYGTGAIMAVPAHDQRDFEFANKFNLPVKYVIAPTFGEPQDDEVSKKAIISVVRNTHDNTVIVLDWGERKERYGGNMLIGGTMRDGEDAEATARREIVEETGYTDLKLVSKSEVPGFGHFYSNTKNHNVAVETTGLLFDIVSDTREVTSLDEGEKGKFAVTWQPVSGVGTMLDDGIHAYYFKSLVLGESFSDEGIMINSGLYDGMMSSDAREKIVADLQTKGAGSEKVNYKLRDWIFSRQHYWGEPIPIIHCPEHGAVPVPDNQLPVELPAVEHYEPTDNGESPLAAIVDWVNTTCPVCEKPAKRETDTMPNWAGSSWYYLRYYDAHNNQAFAARDKLDYWGEVDMYLGGMEHTTLHLLYSRFWHQFFYDQGLVPTREPYRARRGQGIILAADGTKMSKSKGNVVNPNEIIDSGYGADALRLAIAFLAPYDQTTPWSPESLGGTFRFLQRAWTLVQEFKSADREQNTDASETILRSAHQAIAKVSKDIETLGFNTAIAALMEYVNDLYKVKAEHGFAAKKEWEFGLTVLTQLLAPFAPHISEELWHELGHEDSVHISSWPVHDETLLVRDTATIVIQVNGKLRASIEVPSDSDENSVIENARQHEKIKPYLENGQVRKTIYIPGKLVNLVVS